MDTSFASGLFGMFEYRWTIRLSQALNHHYRSQLFERIQRLPMTAFDEEQIGDSIYRVMYDTPATIYYNVSQIFKIADRDKITSREAADRMAQERIETIGKIKLAYMGNRPHRFPGRNRNA